MNLDPNDYTPTKWISDMYGPNGVAYNAAGYLSHHFTYQSVNYYISPDSEIFVFMPSGWVCSHDSFDAERNLPKEVCVAAKLWVKADYKALPVYQFLSEMFN